VTATTLMYAEKEAEEKLKECEKAIRESAVRLSNRSTTSEASNFRASMRVSASADSAQSSIGSAAEVVPMDSDDEFGSTIQRLQNLCQQLANGQSNLAAAQNSMQAQVGELLQRHTALEQRVCTLKEGCRVQHVVGPYLSSGAQRQHAIDAHHTLAHERGSAVQRNAERVPIKHQYDSVALGTAQLTSAASSASSRPKPKPKNAAKSHSIDVSVGDFSLQPLQLASSTHRDKVREMLGSESDSGAGNGSQV